MSTIPRVSVCLPVRNGEKFLRQCIDSLLAQTYTDFELIITDNASTDSTESICREYAARDGRVRCVRHQTNLGPAGNFNSGLELARGQYFRWQAHDDLLEPQYLARCVETLDADPSVVMAYPRALIIDADGNDVQRYDYALATDQPGACARFRAAVFAPQRQHRNFEIFGLTRTAAVKQTPRQGAYSHADRVLTTRLSLIGRMRQVPEYLFLPRSHATQSMQSLPKRNGSLLSRYLGPGVLPPPEWWNPALKGRVTFPEWNLLRELIRSLKHVPLSAAQRAGCRLVLCEWIARRWPKLARDVAFATETGIVRFDEWMRKTDGEVSESSVTEVAR